MLFIARFTDDANRLSVRQKCMSDHLQWLEQHRNAVLVAGSLRRETTGIPIGAFWIVESESKEKVEELLRTDPFWVQGLRQSVEVLHWVKAFPDRKAPV